MAYLAVIASLAHTYAQKSDARVHVYDARLAMFRVKFGVYAKPTQEQRAAMWDWSTMPKA